MAVMALEDVVKQLQVNKRATDDVRKVLTDFILMTKRNMLDQLESDREAKKQSKETTKQVSKPAKGGKKGGGGLNFIGIPALGGILAGLTAAIATIGVGLVAITAGIVAVEAGFRPLLGFEKNALKAVKNMIKFPVAVSNAVIRLRTAALAVFGLTPGNMPIRGADGKMTKAIPIATQIATKLASMKAAFLLNFGIGVDGKNVTRGGPRGMTQQPLWSRVGRAIIRITAPLVNLVTGITAWFGGKGLKIVTFAKDFIGKGGAKIFTALSRILWPLTILMTLFDGVAAYKDKEGSTYEKWGAGIGGFLGTMVGSMFDLAKGAINWILKKIIPGAVDADGNWDESTIIGGWMSTFESFSFADTIQNMIEGLFALPKQAIEWIKLLFTDPKEALTKLLTGVLGGALSLLDILWMPARLAISFVKDIFGYSEDDAPIFSFKTFVLESFDKVVKFFKESVPKIVDGITEAVSTAKDNMIQWAKDLGPRMAGAITGAFGVVTEWLGGLGEKIGYAIQEWWINTKFSLAKGLLRLAEWFEELPQILLLMVKKATRVGIGRQRRRDADQAKIDAFTGDNARTSQLIAGMDDLRDEQLRALAANKPSGTSISDNSSTNTNVINLQNSGPVVAVDGFN